MVGEEARACAGLAVRMFSEGVESMGRGDAMQTYEVFYETVKALAIAKGLMRLGSAWKSWALLYRSLSC